MTQLRFLVCALLLPTAVLAYEPVQLVTDPSNGTRVIIEPKTTAPNRKAESTVVSDCSGNKITIVNTGTRIARGGGNAAGVTINGHSITADDKTIECDAN